MSAESATEPKSLSQLCEMQEGLLQRCLTFLEDCVVFEDAEPTSFYLRLLDDLRAHVDPDAPPPADAKLLALANGYLHSLIDRYGQAWRAAENAKDLTNEIWNEKHVAHQELLRAAGVID